MLTIMRLLEPIPLPRIPVIFITVREEVKDEIRGMALGAMDFIHKPINRDLLLLRIRKALDK